MDDSAIRVPAEYCLSYAFTSTYLSPPYENVVSQGVLKAKGTEAFQQDTFLPGGKPK
jgi:hypothetical protein